MLLLLLFMIQKLAESQKCNFMTEVLLWYIAGNIGGIAKQTHRLLKLFV